MSTKQINLNELRNLVKSLINEEYNSSEIVKIVDRAYKYKTQVIDLKFPTKFLDKEIKNYTQEDYENDLKRLKNFDINLFWNRSFWHLNSTDSITAIATGPYTKFKKLLS